MRQLLTVPFSPRKSVLGLIQMIQPSQTTYMDAVLRPNRSLSPRGFAIVMSVVALASFLSGMAFLSYGALPVVGFFGLDALLIYLAFRWSFRRQTEQTSIRVTSDQLFLHHSSPGKPDKTAEIPTAFARIELDEPILPTSFLRIEYGRTAFVVGRFLTVPERKSLATALRQALLSARAERYPG
jgi:uncharacterized membrane protein